MRVLYDSQCFNAGTFNGVSTYFSEIIPLLIEQGVDCGFAFNYTDSFPLLKKNLRHFYTTPFGKNTRVVNRLRMKLGEIESRQAIKKGDFDILHATQYVPYVFDVTDKPVVITIHDMVQEVFNILPVDIANKRESISKATKIIAISENTKRDILHFYPTIDPNRIVVIHHGFTNHGNGDVVLNKSPYILYVGQRAGYKNFKLFVESIAPILQINKHISLVCTGVPFNQVEQQLLKVLNISNQCSSRFYSDKELIDLYRKALCFVYPSLYEGFGLPILDAFANGCPVVLSNSSCFPEVAGDAGEYFDPRSKESISSAVERVIYSENKREEMMVKGLERVKLFTWEKSATLHEQLYRSL